MFVFVIVPVFPVSSYRFRVAPWFTVITPSSSPLLTVCPFRQRLILLSTLHFSLKDTSCVRYQLPAVSGRLSLLNHGPNEMPSWVCTSSAGNWTFLKESVCPSEISIVCEVPSAFHPIPESSFFTRPDNAADPPAATTVTPSLTVIVLPSARMPLLEDPDPMAITEALSSIARFP